MYYDTDGTRLTNCCKALSTYDPDSEMLLCNTCRHAVVGGQGDGTEDNHTTTTQDTTMPITTTTTPQPSMIDLLNKLREQKTGTVGLNERRHLLGRGFHYKCTNKWTVSIQWHDASYCSIRWQGNDEPCDSPDAEVAVFNADGNMVCLDEVESVLGWQSPDKVLALIDKVETSPDWDTVWGEE